MRRTFDSIDDIPFPSFEVLLDVKRSSQSYALTNGGEVFYEFSIDTRDHEGKDKLSYYVYVKYDSKNFDRSINFSSVQYTEEDAKEMWYTAIEKLRTNYAFFGE